MKTGFTFLFLLAVSTAKGAFLENARNAPTREIVNLPEDVEAPSEPRRHVRPMRYRPAKYAIPKGPINCDFDLDECEYIQVLDGSDNFNWSRAQTTPSSNTGPDADHTDGTGYFMFIETSDPRVSGEVAALMSGISPDTRGSCLQFWHHMYGTNIGKLEVYLKTVSDYNATLIWKQETSLPPVWLPAQIDIIADEEFQIIFKAYVGSSWAGDIAIDDIELLLGLCPPPGPSDLYCNFEDDLACNYEQDRSDDFNWLQTNGGASKV